MSIEQFDPMRSGIFAARNQVNETKHLQKEYQIMKTRHLLFGLLILLGCISCSDDDPQPEIQPDKIKKAEITGLVKLWNEGLTGVGNEDMTVRIEGLDISAITDAEGKFTLPDVPFGTYVLVYEKDGYGTYKELGRTHSISNYQLDPVTINLGQVSPTEVTDLSVELIGTDVVLTVTTDPPGSDDNEQFIRLYWSFSLSDFDNDAMPLIDYNNMRITHSNPQTITIPLQDVLDPMCWGYGTLYSGE